MRMLFWKLVLFGRDIYKENKRFVVLLKLIIQFDQTLLLKGMTKLVELQEKTQKELGGGGEVSTHMGFDFSDEIAYAVSKGNFHPLAKDLSSTLGESVIFMKMMDVDALVASIEQRISKLKKVDSKNKSSENTALITNLKARLLLLSQVLKASSAIIEANFAISTLPDLKIDLVGLNCD